MNKKKLDLFSKEHFNTLHEAAVTAGKIFNMEDDLKSSVDDMAKKYANEKYPYDVEGSRLGDMQDMRDSMAHHAAIGNYKAGYSASLSTIAQLQATNLELSKRVFELEKGVIDFAEWRELDYVYHNNGYWLKDEDMAGKEYTTQDLLQIYKQHKLKEK